MKKMIIVTLTAVSLFSLAACGTKEAPAPVVAPVEVTVEAPAPVVEDPVVEEVVEEEPVIEEVVEEPVVEEATVEPTYVEAHNLQTVAAPYSGAYSFTEYNKNDNGEIIEETTQQFNCPFEVTSTVTDNGDGTKTIAMKAVYDIRDWSLEYDNYTSDTYLCDTYSGVIFSNDVDSVEVNGEKISISYQFEDEYDENYTTHTKINTITCPVDYDGCAMYIGETPVASLLRHYPSLDDCVCHNNGNAVIIFAE